jgi:hypothetical protein
VIHAGDALYLLFRVGLVGHGQLSW